MATGYDQIRGMTDDEMMEYLKKFARSYFFKGIIKGECGCDTMHLHEHLEKELDKNIDKHSNSI